MMGLVLAAMIGSIDVAPGITIFFPPIFIGQ